MPRCRSLRTSDDGPRCHLQDGHDGPHVAEILWSGGVLVPEHDADDATVKFPPIRETVHLRRPPPPSAKLLQGAELMRALAAEIERDLAADFCQALNTARGDGVDYQCEQPPGHEGQHTALNGWVRWS